MVKYFSWKLDDKQYAYLYIPNSKKHISERITDTEIINKIINKINSWDEKKFISVFNEMNNEVFENFGITIPFSDDYFNGEKKSNIVIMNNLKIEEIKNELLDLIDNKFANINKNIENNNSNIIDILNKRTIDTVKSSKEEYNKALNELKDVKINVEEKFNKANKNLEKAAKILELNDNEINSDSLKDLFLTSNNSKKWIEKNSNEIETIKKDYNDFNKTLSVEERGNIFKHMLKRVERVENENIELADTNKNLKNTLKIIQKEQNDLKSSKEVIMGSSNNKSLTYGDYNFEINDKQIKLSNSNKNISIILNDSGIYINGDVFINGNKI